MPAIPKFAKVYAYDPNLLNIYMANIKERIDLMTKYPNGSVIAYNCDSKFSSRERVLMAHGLDLLVNAIHQSVAQMSPELFHCKFNIRKGRTHHIRSSIRRFH